MASDFVLSIKEIKGESQKDNAVGSMEIDEWSISAAGTVDVSNNARGRPRMTELLVRKRTDKATPALYQCCTQNILLSEVTLVGQKASTGNKKIDFLTIKLSNARIRSVSTKLAQPVDMWPMENVAIVYQKISITYAEQGEDAGKQGPATFEHSWDE